MLTSDPQLIQSGSEQGTTNFVVLLAKLPGGTLVSTGSLI